MRFLLASLYSVLLCGSALGADSAVNLSAIDMAIEYSNGSPHIITVRINPKGHLQVENHGLIPARDGGFNSVIRNELEHGSITTILHVKQDGSAFSGEYTVFSGSGAYSGARGHGSLTTLTGHDASASSMGVYLSRLQLSVPDPVLASEPLTPSLH